MVDSTAMPTFLTALSKINNFMPHRNAPVMQKTMIENPEEFYPNHQSYVEHTNWINFTELELPRPIYMNIVRHPLEGVINAYYYLRTSSPHLKSISQDNITLSFNECVKRKVYPYCVFDSYNEYNEDWRRFSLHFCGNQKIC
ncbi:hypothetical protein DOY81_012647, partial [Sarcophaga bullata]